MSYADRNRRAQSELRRLGLPEGPEKGAMYRLRKARAERAGLSGAQGVGKPRKAESSITELRAAGRLSSLRGSLAPPRATQLPGNAGTLYNTTSKSFLRGELRKAEREGKRVGLRITADRGDGPRTIYVAGAGDQGPHRHMRDVVANVPRDQLSKRTGRIKAGAGDYSSTSDTSLVKKPELLISGDPTLISGSGFDPGLLADYLDAYDDIEDAFVDIYDAEYEDAAR